MNETQRVSVNEQVLSLVAKAEKAEKADDALKFSQAAVSTFNQPLQPVFLSATPPDQIDYVDWNGVPEDVIASRVNQLTPEKQEGTYGR